MQNPQFELLILFTGEVNFSRNVIQNINNNHLSPKENTYAITDIHFLLKFLVNLWTGIISKHFIGAFFLTERIVLLALSKSTTAAAAQECTLGNK